MYLELGQVKELDPKGGKNKGWLRFSLYLFSATGKQIVQVGGFRYNEADGTFKNVVMKRPGKANGYFVIAALDEIAYSHLRNALVSVAAEARSRIKEFETERGRAANLTEQRAIWNSLTRFIAGEKDTPVAK